MHHYRKHIKDYRAKTSHLSLLDHGVYNQLMDLYYLNEHPLTGDFDELSWEIGARTDEEIASLRRILRHYFDQNSDGNYTQNKIEEELQAIYEKSEKARKSAQTKWDRQREKEQLSQQRSTEIDQHLCVSHANASKNHANASKIDAIAMLPSNPLPSNPLPSTTHSVDTKECDNKKSRRKTFKKPSPDEIADYMEQLVGKRPEVEHQKFYDYYESNGWKVSRNPMKDWKATVRNWLRRNHPQGRQSSNTKFEKATQSHIHNAKEFLNDE